MLVLSGGIDLCSDSVVASQKSVVETADKQGLSSHKREIEPFPPTPKMPLTVLGKVFPINKKAKSKPGLILRHINPNMKHRFIISSNLLCFYLVSNRYREMTVMKKTTSKSYFVLGLLFLCFSEQWFWG